MDSKADDFIAVAGEPAPPSYAESNAPNIKEINPIHEHYSKTITNQLQAFLTQFGALKSQETLFSSVKDEQILSSLTINIQAYLSEFANSGKKKGTLILVPAAGLREDENAMPCDYDFSDPNEFDRVIKMALAGTERPPADEYESSPDDSELMFWQDEAMARRLAACLTPAPDPQAAAISTPAPSAPRSPKHNEFAFVRVDSFGRQVYDTPPPKPSKSFWGRRKGSVAAASPTTISVSSSDARAAGTAASTATSSSSTSQDVPVDIKTKHPQPPPKEDRVVMEVLAEEVVFRTENDLGIYGTETGWAVILKLNLIMAEP